MRQRECFQISILRVRAVLLDGSYDPVAISTCVGRRSRAKDPRVSHGQPFVVIDRCKRAFESPPREPGEELPPIAKIHRPRPMKLPSIVTSGRLLSSTHCVPLYTGFAAAINFTGIDVCPPSQLAPIYNPSASWSSSRSFLFQFPRCVRARHAAAICEPRKCSLKIFSQVEVVIAVG